MAPKLTADQVRRKEEVLAFLKTTDHVGSLVTELDSNRAAKSQVIENICERIARELSHMRQRALTTNIGTIADVAGTMSVMAGRGGGIDMKIRGLTDGVSSLRMQLDWALKQATTPEKQTPEAPP
ncbi:MAG TPA: hypothetical protein VEK78_15915 [Gemmatimonadales bacterium]|nr:hypothetical protein [Gemmatimonadales bacterium]